MSIRRRSESFVRFALPLVPLALAGLLITCRPAISLAGTGPGPIQGSTISGTALAENGAGLQDLVITLESMTRSEEAGQGTQPGETEEALVINQGGRFFPDLLVVPIVTRVRFGSGDGLFHTAEISDAGRLLSHLALPQDGRRVDYTFTVPGVVAIKDWMNPRRDVAYIVVTENRYSDISNSQGRFVIRGVPAGTYTLRAWHKDLGSRTFTFPATITGGKETSVKLMFREPKLVSMPAELPMRVVSGNGE